MVFAAIVAVKNLAHMLRTTESVAALGAATAIEAGVIVYTAKKVLPTSKQ